MQSQAANRRSAENPETQDPEGLKAAQTKLHALSIDAGCTLAAMRKCRELLAMYEAQLIAFNRQIAVAGQERIAAMGIDPPERKTPKH